MKNVKLKGVEEKIANCDLLTAALLKLSAVDTLDADAVLVEMQSFENVLDQAQTNLSKKLGNEVGVQNVSSFFKDAPASSGGANSNEANQRSTDGDKSSERTSGTKTGSKTYLASWRKLRHKNSSANLASHTTFRETPKENLNMESLPMTNATSVSSRHQKREAVPLKPEGPNANYMGALAKLCEAAQVLGKSFHFPCALLCHYDCQY